MTFIVGEGVLNSEIYRRLSALIKNTLRHNPEYLSGLYICGKVRSPFLALCRTGTPRIAIIQTFVLLISVFCNN
jgi:hypothetical protein